MYKNENAVSGDIDENTGSVDGQGTTTVGNSSSSGMQDEPGVSSEPGENSIESLPEWAQKEIRQVRSEAAKYRTEAKSLRESLEGAKTQEDIDAAISEWQEKAAAFEVETMRLKAASHHGLPDDLAEMLTGSTVEELDAQATKLAKYVSPPSRPGAGAPKEKPAGGRNPEIEDSLPDDPRKLAEMVPSQY